jgi:hypothetical protein
MAKRKSRSSRRRRDLDQRQSTDVTDLRAAVLLAAERVGRSGRGQDGLVDYLEYVARSQPKLFLPLLLKVLKDELNNRKRTNPDRDPNHRFESIEEIEEEFRARGLPMPTKLIEVNPPRE